MPLIIIEAMLKGGNENKELANKYMKKERWLDLEKRNAVGLFIWSSNAEVAYVTEQIHYKE